MTRYKKEKKMLVSENLIAVWWIFHTLLCIHTTRPRADILHCWQERGRGWMTWHMNRVKKYEFMGGNGLFSCPYLSFCSGEALAFRGVLCRESDELFSEGYFKSSIFHTISLSNYEQHERAWISSWTIKPVTEMQKKNTTKTAWIASSGLLAQYMPQGGIAVIQILWEQCLH